MSIAWNQDTTMRSKSYSCGYCGNSLASEKGFPGVAPSAPHVESPIYICHFCYQPTFFPFTGGQYPGTPFGNKVKHIPTKEVEMLYDEARNCVTVNAFTASVQCCRKLLMNIAVSKGATEGLRYTEYVTYLESNGFVPPGGKDWVDHIRTKGNEAAHEIAIMIRQDAEDLITFVEALLKFIYEYPGMLTERRKESTST